MKEARIPSLPSPHSQQRIPILLMPSLRGKNKKVEGQGTENELSALPSAPEGAVESGLGVEILI